MPFKSKFTDFLGMDLWLTCFCLRKAKKHCHPCILVGPVIQGKPVEYFNRRVLWVPAADPYQVESGPYGAVRDGGGVIRDVQRIGRVTVPIEKHLSIVDNWVNDALGGSVDGLSGSVIEIIGISIVVITSGIDSSHSLGLKKVFSLKITSFSGQTSSFCRIQMW